MLARWPTVALLVAVGASLAFVFVKTRKVRPAPWTASVASAIPSASASAAPHTVSVDAGAPAPALDLREETERIADGATPPPLPAGAPTSVHFGAILFTYRGAQLAAAEGRTKDEARTAAVKALPEAKTNFAEAAKKGDAGSTADAGDIPRGILEPHLEYLLFTLPPKTLLEYPVDTPRGYLVVKRL